MIAEHKIGYWARELAFTRQQRGRLTRGYIRSFRDPALPPDAQNRMIRDADEWAPQYGFLLQDLDNNHSPPEVARRYTRTIGFPEVDRRARRCHQGRRFSQKRTFTEIPYPFRIICKAPRCTLPLCPVPGV